MHPKAVEGLLEEGVLAEGGFSLPEVGGLGPWGRACVIRTSAPGLWPSRTGRRSSVAAGSSILVLGGTSRRLPYFNC
jgi:hypothetical protein